MHEKPPKIAKEREASLEAISEAEVRVKQSWERLKPLLSNAELALTKGTVKALGGFDAVMRRLPPKAQEFLHGVALEQIMGMPPPPPPAGDRDPSSSVIEALYGIASVKSKRK